MDCRYLQIVDPQPPPQEAKAGDISRVNVAALEAQCLLPQGTVQWSCLLQKDASKANIVRELPNASLIQFYCHGIADPLTSYSQEDGALLVGGDYLTAADMRAMELSPGCVVILHCCFGLAGRSLEDGVTSIAQACLQSGASCCVATLWSARVGAVIRHNWLLYDQLRQGHTVGQAMRHAAIQMIQDRNKWSEPVFWGVFECWGDPSARPFPRSDDWKSLIVKWLRKFGL